MKIRPILTLTLVLASTLLVSSAQAKLKVGVVDMNEAFVSYYKTKEAEGKINTAREEAKAADAASEAVESAG